METQTFLGESQGDAGQCWEWKRSLTHDGYGRVWLNDQRIYAHRASYELRVGPIPGDLVVDHLCRNRACVNPEHLEIVTFEENVRRGERATKTHCVNGHPFDISNTYLGPRGRRCCRACNRIAVARYSARKGKTA